MVYGGSAGGQYGGHAFVCDGYDSEGYYHFNWGWDGECNGWFLLSAMNPRGGQGYVDLQELVGNIARPGQAGEKPAAGSLACSFDPLTGTLTVGCTGSMEALDDNTRYEWYAWKDQIRKVVFEEGIDYIAYNAFNGFPNLETVVLPEGLEKIDNAAFADCPIRSMQLPQSMVYIGADAFRGSMLERVEVGPDVTFINCAFGNSPRLASFDVSPENKEFCSEDGVIYNKAKNKLLCYPSGKKTFELPETVTTIASNSARGLCLTEIVVPEWVTSIGDYAFAFSETLQSASLPSLLHEVADGLFYLNNKLKTVDVGNRVTRIGNSAFCYCSQLESLTLPSKVTELGNWALSGCNSLRQLTCLAATAPVLADYALPTSSSYQSVLTVPEGSDYSSWMAALPSQWRIACCEPQYPAGNSESYSREWLRYAHTPYLLNETVGNGSVETLMSDCAIRLMPSANAVVDGLDVEGRTVHAMSVMAIGQTVSHAKAWLSTTLPDDPSEADLIVFDIPADEFRRGQFTDFSLPHPVVIPEGGCYAGFSFESEGNEVPYMKESNNPLGWRIAHSCFERNNASQPQWTDNSEECRLTICVMMGGQYWDVNVAPYMAVKTTAMRNRPTTALLGFTSIGLNRKIDTIGVKYFDSATRQWTETEEIVIDSDIAMGSEKRIEFTVPAMEKSGVWVDSVAIATVNGCPNPAAHSSVPLSIYVTDQPASKVTFVSNMLSKAKGDALLANAAADRLKSEFGDKVAIVNFWQGDPLFGGSATFEHSPTSAWINDEPYTRYHPYYGAGSEGYGIGDAVRREVERPAPVSVQTKAMWWSDESSRVRLQTKVKALMDIEEGEYTIIYYLLGDGLHGSGDAWHVRNDMAAQYTDDDALKPLTELPATVTDHVFNDVLLMRIQASAYNDGMYYSLAVPALRQGEEWEYNDILNLIFWSHFDHPETLGIGFENLKIQTQLFNSLFNKVDNCTITPISGLKHPDELVAGDVNGDGQITVADLTLLLEIINGRTSDFFGTADMDGWGDIDEEDVAPLVNKILVE